MCGIEFVINRPRKYCSPECLRKHRNQYHLDIYYRRRKPKKCVICSKEFFAVAGELVCSDECRKAKNKKICQRCGAVFIGEKKQKCCSLKCAGLLMFSENPRIASYARNKERIEKATKALRTMLTGTHGKGMTARDSAEHCRAKWYRIRSPLGEVFEIKNLTSWCRKNSAMFTKQIDLENKSPIEILARKGLCRVSSGVDCSWHGWTAVSVFDIESDPLLRKTK